MLYALAELAHVILIIGIWSYPLTFHTLTATTILAADAPAEVSQNRAAGGQQPAPRNKPTRVPPQPSRLDPSFPRSARRDLGARPAQR